MSRRITLPGADELFRRTDTSPLVGATAPAADPTSEPDDAAPATGLALVGADAPTVRTVRPARARRRGADRRPTGRTLHEEKITVYVSSEELVDLEQAKIALRGEHGLAVDRGRIVREAVAVVLADLEARGADSILVRRLRGL